MSNAFLAACRLKLDPSCAYTYCEIIIRNAQNELLIVQGHEGVAHYNEALINHTPPESIPMWVRRLEVPMIQDLIEDWDMNFSQGNILKALYRIGHCKHSESVRDLNKVVWFATREKERIDRQINLKLKFEEWLRSEEGK